MKPIQKNKLIILLAFALLIIITVPTSVYGYNNSSFKKYYNNGLNALAKENFDEAATNFKKAEKYKKDSKDIQSKLSEIELLRASKITFEKAEKFMADKDFMQAIDTYMQITAETSKYYNLAQAKIKTASDEYIKDNLNKANQAAGDRKYEDAIKYLDSILKFQPSYAEASSLKEKFNGEIAKLKKEEEDRKKAEEGTKQVASTSGNTSTSTITAKVEGASIFMLDNGKKYGYHFNYAFNSNRGTVFLFTSGRSPETDEMSPDVNYTIKFKAASQTVSVSGISTLTDEYKSIPFDKSKFQPNQNYEIVAEITMVYKGKPYSFTTTFAYKVA